MRAACLIVLLIVPGVHAAQLTVGDVEIVTSAPVASSVPAVGDDFRAWLDASNSIDVRLQFRGDRTIYSISEPAAWDKSNHDVRGGGDLVVWTRTRNVQASPGSEVLSLNTDYVVYDVRRSSEIYDSRSSDQNESQVVTANGRVGFFSDAGGQQRFWLTATTGPDAFQPYLVRQDGPQYQARLGADRVVLLEAGPEGQRIVSVDLASGDAQTMAVARDGVGVASPRLSGDRTAWIEHEGPISRIVVDEAGVRQVWNDTGSYRFNALEIKGDLVVAEAVERNTQRRLVVAMCLPDGEMETVSPSGSFSRPAPTPWGTVLMLRLVHNEFILYEQTLYCGDPPTLAGERAAAGPILLPAVLMALVLTRRTTRRSSLNAECRRD